MDVPGPPPVKLKINSNIFKELATEWNMQKEMDGMISGIVIEKNLRTAPAPSRSADSFSSVGTPCIPAT